MMAIQPAGSDNMSSNSNSNNSMSVVHDTRTLPGIRRLCNNGQKVRTRRPGILKKFCTLKIVQLMCGIYITVLTFTDVGTLGSVGGYVDTSSGYIIDLTENSKQNTEDGVIFVTTGGGSGSYRAIVAVTRSQMVFLAISRFAAFTMYPCLVAVFLTKFRATNNFISSTYVGTLFYLPNDHHDLHIYCGNYILIAGCIHSIFHLARWAMQRNMYLLTTNRSGVSGIVIIVSSLLICLPMIVSWVKTNIRYEIRKLTHYLFLVFAVAMCFHSPPPKSAVVPNGGFAPYVFGTLLVWWTVDNIYVQLFMTEKIQSSRFVAVSSGTGMQLTMDVSERFQKWGSGGYCYICLPWVDPYQWHAFSLYENPINPEERRIFIEKVGDWTAQVHTSLVDLVGWTHRPAWVQGPFVSPYGLATDEYGKHVLVAGGIGITPALSVIRRFKRERRCNLIWSTRDSSMLEFFLKHADLSQHGWNLIFYTGNEPLWGMEDVVVTSNGSIVYIIRQQRPNFSCILPNIIYGIESKTCTPEMFVPDERDVALSLLQEKLYELNEVQSPGGRPLDTHEKMNELENYCNEQLGYLFNDLVSNIPTIEEATAARNTSPNANTTTEPRRPSTRTEDNNNRRGMLERSSSVLDAIANYESSEFINVTPEDSTIATATAADACTSTSGNRRGDMMKSSTMNAVMTRSRRLLIREASSNNRFRTKMDIETAAATPPSTSTTTNQRSKRGSNSMGMGVGVGVTSNSKFRRSKGSFTTTTFDDLMNGSYTSNTTTTHNDDMPTGAAAAAADASDDVELLDDDDDCKPLTGSPTSDQQQHQSLYRPWVRNEEADMYVKDVDPNILSTWGVLYCGGRGALRKSVKDAARNIGVDVHEESFRW